MRVTLARWSKGILIINAYRPNPAVNWTASTLRVPAASYFSVGPSDMPHISIYLNANSSSAPHVAAVRAATGRSVADISRAIVEGLPVFEGEIFAWPREETIAKVFALLNRLDQLGVRPIIKENERAISRKVLHNIVVSSHESMARFAELDDLGHA